MPVEEDRNGTRPEPDEDILPANMRVSLGDELFRLETRVSDEVPRPIDYFFAPWTHISKPGRSVWSFRARIPTAPWG